MPIKDGEAYLAQALSSTLRRLPRDADLHVMDDGSTDSTPNILASFADQDRRVVLHRHETGAGVAASLNELLAASDSRYVARMDGDDVCLPLRWSVGERLLATSDLAFMAPIFIDGRGRVRGTDQPGRFSAKAVPFHLLLGSMLVHPTAMMRRDVVESLGGYRRVAAEDYDLWLRAAAAGRRIVRSAVPGLLYRRHGSQVTARSPWDVEEERNHLWGPYSALSEWLGVDLPPDAGTTLTAVFPSQPSAVDLALRAKLVERIVARADQVVGATDRLHIRVRGRRALSDPRFTGP